MQEVRLWIPHHRENISAYAVVIKASLPFNRSSNSPKLANPLGKVFRVHVDGKRGSHQRNRASQRDKEKAPHRDSRFVFENGEISSGNRRAKVLVRMQSNKVRPGSCSELALVGLCAYFVNRTACGKLFDNASTSNHGA
jgi:hypothetical protein